MRRGLLWSPALRLPFFDSVLRPVAVVFIELPLPLVHLVGIHVGIMADVERADNAVIGSLFSVRAQALANHKNLLSETLDIVAIFLHHAPPDRIQQGGCGNSCLLIRYLLTFCVLMALINLACDAVEKRDLMHR